MRIVSSDVILASQRSFSAQHEVKQSLRMWATQPVPARPVPSLLPPPSAEATAPSQETGTVDDQNAIDPGLMALKLLLEKMLGHKIRIFTKADLKLRSDAPPPPQLANPMGNSEMARGGWGVDFQRTETYHEQEQTSVAAAGVVQTADGQTIQFAVEVQMAREFYQQTNTRIQLGDAARTTDPLVINFSGTAAQLTDAKFSFDLNSDGSAEQISFVSPGSGFIVFDRNGDGKINNGGELFGPASGDGFAELAAYDQDGNHWIDEADAVYQQLGVWSKDAQGQDQLTSLAAAGVGAIYLANVASSFSVKDAANQLQGQVQSTGIYLGENGGVNTIQQVDLAI